MQDLAARNEAAIARWQKLVAALRFFEERRAWASGQSRAVVAVISTFSGANEFLATEVLNLAARRNLLHSVLLTSQAASADLKPLKAIICVDAEAPAEALRRKLGYGVPTTVADLVAARPIHLAIIDGIRTQARGETAGVRGAVPVAPGVLIAGTNCVCTDAVGMAVMGFDPLADRGKAPFERSDSTLRLAESLGVGTRDLSRIEVIGTPIAQVRFDFRNPVRAPDPA